MTPDERREARRICLQILCTLDVQGNEAWPAIELFLAEVEGRDAAVDWAREAARGTFEKTALWDGQLASVSQRWDVRRMGLVDRNILRLALYEMSRPEVTPVKVALNEAIELAKEFGTEESPAFVNGVLDAIWRRQSAADARTEAGEGDAGG